MNEKIIKKVIIDKVKCIGCGSCSVVAPEAFGFDESELKAFVKKDAETVDDAKLEDAAGRCPTQAISFEK